MALVILHKARKLFHKNYLEILSIRRLLLIFILSIDPSGPCIQELDLAQKKLPGQRSEFYEDKTLKLSEEGEVQKAKEIADYYRICFAHPAVEGILMWGFWEGANWIKASSLYKRDWSPTPALKTYQDLIFGEWTTSLSLTLDENGEAAVPAFYGDYKISSGQEALYVSLKKKEGSQSVFLQKSL